MVHIGPGQVFSPSWDGTPSPKFWLSKTWISRNGKLQRYMSIRALHHLDGRTASTRSSTVAERPRDATCHWI